MIKINLVGQNHLRELASRRAKLWFVVMLATVAVTSGMVAGFLFRSLAALRSDSEVKIALSQQVQAMRKKIVSLEQQRKELGPRLQGLRSVFGQLPHAAQLLEALSKSIPHDAWLTQVRFVEGEVELIGIAPSESISTAFVHQLRETKIFSEVTLTKTTLREQSRVGAQEFVVKAKLAVSDTQIPLAALEGKGGGHT